MSELEAEIEDLRAWRREWTETAARIMSEKCPHDEMHCGCVPFLRAKIKELEVDLEKEQQNHSSTADEWKVAVEEIERLKAKNKKLREVIGDINDKETQD